jgi:LAO/AO transport system kinase
MRASEDISALLTQVVEKTAGRKRAAARLMSILENNPERIPELYSGLADWPEPRMVIGITGPPGAGKSTLTDRLISCYRLRHPERKIGVIAVDPSSPFNGGALLGDRVHMMRHATDPKVFMRSLASRGHLGGLTLGIQGVIRVMGLLDCELIILETVGVGQSEIEVARIADMVTIILAPGQGDGIQLLKSGLMEAGDLFVINKSDREGADQLQAQLRSTLNMIANCNRHKQSTQMCCTSALEDTGISEFIDLLEARYAYEGHEWLERREKRIEQEIKLAALEESRRQLEHTLATNGTAHELVLNVLQGTTTITQFAAELLSRTAQRQCFEKINEGKVND